MTDTVDPRVLNKTRDECRDALHDLCDVQVRSVWREDGTVTRHQGLSLLDQLRDEVANSSSRGGRRRSSHTSPLAVDALDLWNEIGAGMTMLVSEFDAAPDGQGIEAGLRAVVAAGGMSTDLEALLGLRGFLRAWTNSIRTLLDPPKRVPLWGHPCPVEGCGEKTVWRVDESDNELKRTAALQVSFEEMWSDEKRCHELVAKDACCLACDEPWSRPQLLFLARLLGRDFTGVDLSVLGLVDGESEETGEPAA